MIDAEEPPRNGGTLGHRVSRTQVLLVVIAVLVASNIFTAYHLKAVNDDKLNALGLTLTYTKVLNMVCAEHIDDAVAHGALNQELLETLEGDLVELSRMLIILVHLDGANTQEWSEVTFGVDELTQFSTSLKNKLAYNFVYESGDYCLTEDQSHSLSMMRDALRALNQAFPVNVTIGSNPSVHVPTDGLMNAAEASQRISAIIGKARTSFGLNGN